MLAHRLTQFRSSPAVGVSLRDSAVQTLQISSAVDRSSGPQRPGQALLCALQFGALRKTLDRRFTTQAHIGDRKEGSIMFTGSNASVIRRIRTADEIAIELAQRINRELNYQVPARILSLPLGQRVQCVPGLPLLRPSRACA